MTLDQVKIADVASPDGVLYTAASRSASPCVAAEIVNSRCRQSSGRRKEPAAVIFDYDAKVL